MQDIKVHGNKLEPPSNCIDSLWFWGDFGSHKIIQSSSHPVMSSVQQWTENWERCIVHFMAALHLFKTSYKNSKGHIEVLAGHPLSSSAPPHPSFPPSLNPLSLSLSYFCLLPVQSIPFRPRWLLLGQAAVSFMNNGHMETKASLLGCGVTDRQNEKEKEMERVEDREIECHSAFQCDWTHIWWPCVTGAAGLMMGFLRPAQLGQASPDFQRERGTKRDAYRHAAWLLC